MPPRSKSVNSGGWRAIALSVLLHSAIVAAAVYSWFTWKHSAPETALAVEATLVDERTLKGASRIPAPEPPPPEPVKEPEPLPAPVEEQGPPKPDPAEIERKKEEERLATEKLEQEKQALEKREQAKKEEERQAAAKAAALKAAADKKASEKKRADEAAAAKKAADEKARLAREAELRRSIEAEERDNAASNSDEALRWNAAIIARISRAWIRPPSAQAGVQCNVVVTQVPGGEVTSVRVNGCTGGDEALRQSVEAAAYRASPLPNPPPGVPFKPELDITFAPQ